jgi:hypothetical protein
VQEKALGAKALERVQSDLAEISAGQSSGRPSQVDPALLEKQLAEIRAKATERNGNHLG